MNAMVATAPSLPALHGLQLTRRGRLVFFGIPAIVSAAALVFACLGIIFGSMVSPAHAATQFSTVDMADYATTVTVLEGDSLWSIAAGVDPDRNVRDVVQEIVALNQLGAGVLHAGQQLFVPLPK
ncbi:hypothetical protein JOF48_000058 [Arthrobacter stackebrandtii]|uniref:LysM domain-containing protein n=1 Tax=Arthrobacter stackebrandtii TaxID=272161 RepID=A0ABS4YR69_9MICC|nr:LysM peptidoglycan-binding domain-containing protein [Arthrobacter stackebrandtii]MBP2411259.1 hypothetical protein [Arthrobacter stackebrandtii]PYH00093.1 peptidoglycan-binding protein [Arthrobacter stackebrandtii]